MLKILVCTLLFCLVIVHGMKNGERLLDYYADNKIGGMKHEYEGYKDVFQGNLHGAASQFAQRDEDKYKLTTGGMFNEYMDHGKTAHEYGRMQNYNYQANVDLFTGHPLKALNDYENALNCEIKVDKDECENIGTCLSNAFCFICNCIQGK